ncbi:MAG TPA: hypothetical protein VG186_14345 [Solirubrobacteraceae bacterium]|jgi:hypothetical protein|nr:hypothetical protein [Solirubrobacteraceae bacterium]
MVMPPGHHLEITSRRSFSRREKRTLGVVGACLLALAVVLVIIVAGHNQSTARGCVDVSILGATGGSGIHQCGDNALALCRSVGKPGAKITETAREIEAACRKDGFPVG